MNNLDEKKITKAISIYADEELVEESINSTKDLIKEKHNEVLDVLGKVRQDVIVGNSRKKKKCINYEIINVEGEFKLRKTYDNEDKENVDFIKNFTGEIFLSDVRFYGINVNEGYYALSGKNLAVIAKSSRRSGKAIYDALIDAGIKFETDLPMTTIYRALQEYFAPRIAKMEGGCLDVFALTGWWNRRYYNAYNCARFGNMCDVKMPVQSKYLTYMPSLLTRGRMRKNYLNELNKIKNSDYRIMIMIYPFMSLIKTLLSDVGLTFSKSLCLVNMSNLPNDIFCKWMQIFNRNEAIVHDISTTTKRIEKLIAESKDEVLMYEVYIDSDKGYDQVVQMKNFNNIVRITTGKKNVGEISRKSNVMSAFISNKALEGDVYNLYIDKDTYEYAIEDFNIDDYGAIFTEYISFIEKNFEYAASVIMKNRDERGDIRILEIVYDLVKKYFSCVNVDVCKELNIPTDINWVEVLENLNISETEDYTTEFIELFRRTAKNYYIVDRRQARYLNDIYWIYDDEYLSIPSKIVDDELKKNGLLGSRRRILSQLKENGYLMAEKDSFTTRVVINGVRQECLKLRKELFAMLGREDVEKLGKEIEKC